MNTVATWPSMAETWLDARGKGAWIAAMVLGFVFVWPVGLAIMAYMLFAGKFVMTGRSGQRRGTMRPRRFRSTGNSAFDAYKSDMLTRLEDEQQAFEAFLGRLREAKDKAEFDQFMDERSRGAKQAGEDRASDA